MGEVAREVVGTSTIVSDAEATEEDCVCDIGKAVEESGTATIISAAEAVEANWLGRQRRQEPRRCCGKGNGG
jgi:hypothetical protein